MMRKISGLPHLMSLLPRLAVLLLAAALSPVQAAPLPIAVELQLPADSADVGPQWRQLDGDGPRIRRETDGAWIRITPRSAWPQQELALSVGLLVYGDAQLYAGQPDAPSPPPSTATALPPMGDQGLLAYRLPAGLGADTPLWLHLAPHPEATPVPQIAVEPLDEFTARYTRWVALVSVCMAIMLAMSLVALVFTFLLRDLAFLPYAAYLLSFLLIQQLQTGYGYALLGWDRSAALLPLLGRLSVIGGVLFACLFLMAFSQLRTRSPLAWRVLMAYVLSFVILTALGMLPIPVLVDLARLTLNPLLATGALLLPACAIWSWIGGSRYGAYFLLGWLPLMATTFASSLRLYPAAPPWSWQDETMLMAGAFESLVLSIGLADRTLAHRRRFQSTQALTRTDPLTGLLNRRGWLADVTEQLAHRDAGQPPLQLLFIDLDHFKSLNDQHGHAAGDEALRRTAELLRRHCPEDSLIGRHGGEEFVVALPGLSCRQAGDIAEHLRSALLDLGISVDPSGTLLSLSAGLASAQPGETVDTLLQRADQAMYQAKAQGRNRVARSQPEAISRAPKEAASRP